MTTFSLSYNNLGKAEDAAAIREVMGAWQGWQVQESTWILKRNDGCTCQTIVDDLREMTAREWDVTVKEIGQEFGKAGCKRKTAEQDAKNWSVPIF